MATIQTSRAVSVASLGSRWWQLIFGIVCMVMIANLQYGWTLFVNPIDQKYHWGRAAIQVAFTIFVLTETWLVPIEGYLVDKFGPRPVVLVGGILCGLGWVMNSYAGSLTMLYQVLPPSMSWVIVTACANDESSTHDRFARSYSDATKPKRAMARARAYVSSGLTGSESARACHAWIRARSRA